MSSTVAQLGKTNTLTHSVSTRNVIGILKLPACAYMQLSQKNAC